MTIHYRYKMEKPFDRMEARADNTVSWLNVAAVPNLG